MGSESMRFSLAVLVLCAAVLTNEATAGGHGNSNPGGNSAAAASATVESSAASTATASAEVNGFAKKVEGLSDSMASIENTEKKISNVASELSSDLASAKAVAEGANEELGESGVLGTKRKEKIGEADLPAAEGMRSLRDKIEADVKHDIYSKENAAISAASKLEGQAKALEKEMLSKEELGESSILHDAAKPSTPSVTPLQEEKNEMAQAKNIEKVAHDTVKQQKEAKELTEKIAHQYTDIENSFNKHAGDLQDVNSLKASPPGWLQNDVQELGSMVDESQSLSKAEESAMSSDETAAAQSKTLATSAESQFPAA